MLRFQHYQGNGLAVPRSGTWRGRLYREVRGASWEVLSRGLENYGEEDCDNPDGGAFGRIFVEGMFAWSDETGTV